MTILRPFNTFGPRQSARAIIPTIISQALTRPVVRLGQPRPAPRPDLRQGHGRRASSRSPAATRRSAGWSTSAGARTSRSASWSSGSAARLGRPLRVETDAAARPPGRQRGRPAPGRHGAGPGALGLEAARTRSTRASTRRSPGSATTSTCSGSTPTRPERPSRSQALHRRRIRSSGCRAGLRPARAESLRCPNPPGSPTRT